MIGKSFHNTPNPTVHTSPWETYNYPSAQIIPPSVNTNNSPYLDALLTALSRYLPSNDPEHAVTDTLEPTNGAIVDSDEFRMYEFKVRGCTRPRAHDWTECPFAHPGEKARRRDPRRCSYSGTACADFRKGICRRGDACEFAHGVFECWLHPTRYRTQACKDGLSCTRRVCFFAHAPGQLRVLSGLPSPGSAGSSDPFEEASVGVELSPRTGRADGPGSVGELAATLRNLQLSRVKSMSTGSGWKGQVGLGSPRVGVSDVKAVRAEFCSLPGTPTRSLFRAGGVGYPWEEETVVEGEWERIGLDNQELVDSNMIGSGPDIGWVSELVK